jgi:hypothetical protein
VIVVSSVGAAGGSMAAAAALALATATPLGAGLLLDLAGGRAWRPGVVASAAAREVEERLAAHLPAARVASRGRLCQLSLPPGPEQGDAIAAAAAIGREAGVAVHVPPGQVHALLDCGRVAVGAALLRADLPTDRPLLALAVQSLQERGLRVAVLKRPLGWAAAQLALRGVVTAADRSGFPPRLLGRLGAAASTGMGRGSAETGWGSAAIPASAGEPDTDTGTVPTAADSIPSATGTPAVVWRHARSPRP